ncbi:hypothetical protein V4R08_07800 [Nitrobacter sp. NHB1]|uniref:hypothetical protein n=1 Tax=Nitrobacter sp. NHB1 TaxID=3119830 RepID=UPI002FFF4A2D
MSNQTPNQNKATQQQQNQDQKRDPDEIRKAEIRKAVEQDQIDPKNPKGQQDTGFSGGS